MVPDRFLPLLTTLNPISDLFQRAGYEIFLVGGAVRDIFLDEDVSDLDFTTQAKPDQIKKILTDWADCIWSQ
jgi:poly(A) polymerase